MKKGTEEKHTGKEERKENYVKGDTGKKNKTVKGEREKINEKKHHIQGERNKNTYKLQESIETKYPKAPSKATQTRQEKQESRV